MSTQELVRTKYPLGWVPSQDNVNGDPNGLLRMDNLKLDEIGAITLARGCHNVNSNSFPGFVHSIFSRTINNVKNRFVGLGNGDVWFSADDFINRGHPGNKHGAVAGVGGNPNSIYEADEIINGGSTTQAHFAGIFGSIFVSSGQKRAKFDGTNVFNWGVETPKGAIQGLAASQANLDVSNAAGGVYSNWQLIEGANFTNTTTAQADTDAISFISSVGTVYPSVMDFTSFSAGGTSLPTDVFNINVNIGDTNLLTTTRISFLLGPVTGAITDFQGDYYAYEWPNDLTTFVYQQGQNLWSTLSAMRSQFSRQGNDASLDWSKVGAVVVTITCTAVVTANQVQNLVWKGSSAGPLTGTYDYCQINVRDNGLYQAKSGIGPLMTSKITVLNGSINLAIFQPLDPQVNQIWLYRRGGVVGNFTQVGIINVLTGIYTDSANNTQQLATSPLLPGGPINYIVNDTVTDTTLQDLNITLQQSVFTKSVQDWPDEILGIIDGAYFGKAVMITFKELLISESFNPDAIDTSATIKVSGDVTELMLWVTKISNNVLLVGTTKNLYQIAGTLVNLPDGTIDATIQAIGESHPPISRNFALDSNNVFYMATDGIRNTNGTNSTLISAQLNLLFRNTTRYDIAPVNIQPNALIPYPMVIYKGQLWCVCALQDGTRWVFAYDFALQYWRPLYLDPISLFVEDDGTLLAGWGDTFNVNSVLTLGYFLRVMDTGITVNNTGTQFQGQSIFLQTIFDDNGKARNRKDAYTMRLLMDTGGTDVSVRLAGDNGNYFELGVFNTNWVANGPTEIYIDLFAPFTQVFGLGFRYSLQITGQNLTTFRLLKYSIEYDLRPEQTSALRLLPANLGTFCRKRFTNYAFVIDTLGNDVTFTPIVDGVLLTYQIDTFNYSSKQTYVFYFTSETIGTDISGIIQAIDNEDIFYPGVFEFYELDTNEIISEKLPIPVKFLVIPNNNYGTPNRKRHSSYKFQIDTRGQPVQFTPSIDGTSYAPQTYTTAKKQTVEYFFPTDTIGIDVYGILQTLANTPFEYYGSITPQQIEQLPPRLVEYRIPESNFGIAAQKRIRTLPMMINTFGNSVLFTPIVDGQRLPGTTFNTITRKTVFHYFDTDVFGTDYSGELTNGPFEFYSLEKPEEVEILPVAKVFDQIGPVHITRIGKIIGFRIRIITQETQLPWKLYGQDILIATGTLVTTPGTDNVYEQEWITKSRSCTMVRMEIGPCPNGSPFNRYYVDLKINTGGTDSNIKLQRIDGRTPQQ